MSPFRTPSLRKALYPLFNNFISKMFDSFFLLYSKHVFQVKVFLTLAMTAILSHTSTFKLFRFFVTHGWSASVTVIVLTGKWRSTKSTFLLWNISDNSVDDNEGDKKSHDICLISLPKSRIFYYGFGQKDMVFLFLIGGFSGFKIELQDDHLGHLWKNHPQESD